jgi:hypothetical protein
MPVQRFRSIEDMPRPTLAGEHDLAVRIAAIWRRAFLLCPPSFARGVRRFRSIEEANQDRERATAERMRRLGQR